MKKTSDGRIIGDRVEVVGNNLEELLLDIKERNDWTWEDFAEYLGVSEYTLRRDWRTGDTTLPKPIFQKIQKLSNQAKIPHKEKHSWWGQQKGGRNSTLSVDISIEENTVELAELYGAMLGDGCIYSNMNSLCITGNARLDQWYLETYLSSLFDTVFDIRPKLYRIEKETVIRLTINNRNLTRFFIDKGFPKGRKISSEISIPESFFEEDRLLVACLRGVLDTDGGIYRHPHTDIMMDITAKNESLLHSISRASNQLELKAGKTSDRLQWYGGRVNDVLSVIGSSNPRNIVKYQTYEENDKVPDKEHTETLLNSDCNGFDVPYTGSVV